MGSAGLGLVLAAPDGPAQAVGDGGLVAVNEVEEPADFGEGEIDEMSVDGWLRATRKAITTQWIGYTEQRGTPDSNSNWLQLVHAHCQRPSPPTAPPQHPTQIARTPSRLA